MLKPRILNARSIRTKKNSYRAIIPQKDIQIFLHQDEEKKKYFKVITSFVKLYLYFVKNPSLYIKAAE